MRPDACKDLLGRTALHRAAYFGYTGIVQALLDNGANPNTKSTVRIPAICAALRSYRLTLHLLLQMGTPLRQAGLGRHVDVVQALLAAGAKQ